MQKAFIYFFILCSSLLPIQASGEASAFVEVVVKEALGIVNKNGMSNDAKRKELSECINKYLDIERITQSVFAPLGYKDLKDPADKNKLKAYLKKYLVGFYGGEGKLSMMVGAKLADSPTAEARNGDFAVSTKFTKDGGTTKIVWVTDGKLIFYVELADINQIITLRSEMSAKVQKAIDAEVIKAGLAKEEQLSQWIKLQD